MPTIAPNRTAQFNPCYLKANRLNLALYVAGGYALYKYDKKIATYLLGGLLTIFALAKVKMLPQEIAKPVSQVLSITQLSRQEISKIVCPPTNTPQPTYDPEEFGYNSTTNDLDRFRGTQKQ